MWWQKEELISKETYVRHLLSYICYVMVVGGRTLPPRSLSPPPPPLPLPRNCLLVSSLFTRRKYYCCCCSLYHLFILLSLLATLFVKKKFLIFLNFLLPGGPLSENMDPDPYSEYGSGSRYFKKKNTIIQCCRAESIYFRLRLHSCP